MSRLITCKSCNHQVDKGAKTCPNCGKRLKLNFLSKLVLVIIVLALIGVFFGEKESGQTEQPNDTQTIQHANTENQPQVEHPKEAKPTINSADMSRAEIIKKASPNIDELKRRIKKVEGAGIITKITTNTDNPRVYVNNFFINDMSFKTKQGILDEIMTYYIIKGLKSDFIIVKSAATGKEVGIFKAPWYAPWSPGLEMYANS